MASVPADGAAAGGAAAAAAVAPAAAPADAPAASTGGGGLAPSLAAVRMESTFVSALPGDPVAANYPRQVAHAAYSLVAPTDAAADDVMARVQVPPGDDPTAGGRIKTLPRGLLAWSPDVAASLGVDPAAPPPAVGDATFEALAGAAVVAGGGPAAHAAAVGGGGEGGGAPPPPPAAALLPGSVPYAACYGGHQFGSWAGQLGDGRAITLGEVVPPRGGGRRLEVQLKGAGRTPYSRSADGRAVLRSSVREFLASEAMAGLGVPTTRALALLSTGAGVLRDKFYDGNAGVEPGAIVARVTPTFLRLGSFELPASRGDRPLLKALADYAVTHHFPHLADASEAYAPDGDGGGGGGDDDDDDDDADNKYALLLREVIARNAAMVAHWQAVGFVHGVQNTDNYAITGVTLDYGPYGWLDAYEPDYTPNTTDLPGRRYSYARQPAVAGWNLAQFASALVPLVGVARARAALDTYAPAYAAAWARHAGAKLGLTAFDHTPGVVDGVVADAPPPPPPTADEALLAELLGLMAASKADWTNTWRSLGRVPAAAADDADDAAVVAPLGAALGDGGGADLRPRWAAWVRRYAARVAADGRPDGERRAAMDAANPAYVLRNYMAQVAIEAAEAGDNTELERLRVVLADPYTEQAGAEGYTAPPPSWAGRRGVCMNSCSS